MKTYEPENERIKRRYFTYLKEAMRQSEASVDSVATALSRFEVYTNYRNFKAFHFQQAIAFKNHLSRETSEQTGRLLSKATLNSTMALLKRFFHWLAGQPGYKSRLQFSDAEYFNLSEKDTRIATTRREKPVPTIEQIKHVLNKMPSDTEIEQRNRALIAFILLTGARDSAVASMKLKHVDLATKSIYQDAREVNTKFSKSFTTYFFPVGDEIKEIFSNWVTFLYEKKLWCGDDPIFPSTLIQIGKSHQFEAAGLDRKHWSNSGPIRRIFKDSFIISNLPYFNPHSFRNTLVRLGETACKTPEQFKAWSQNLGHEGVLTTFHSYGSVPNGRQSEIILSLGNRPSEPKMSADEFADEVVRKLRDLDSQLNAL